MGIFWALQKLLAAAGVLGIYSLKVDKAVEAGLELHLSWKIAYYIGDAACFTMSTTEYIIPASKRLNDGEFRGDKWATIE